MNLSRNERRQWSLEFVLVVASSESDGSVARRRSDTHVRPPLWVVAYSLSNREYEDQEELCSFTVCSLVSDVIIGQLRPSHDPLPSHGTKIRLTIVSTNNERIKGPVPGGDVSNAYSAEEVD